MDARHRPNLNIKSNCYVKKIILDKNKAIGIELISESASFEIYADEIILSAGAIESPKLLMNSGIGDSNKLSKHGIITLCDLPGVGQNLRDHPMTFITWKPKNDYISPVNNYSRVAMALRYTSNNSNWTNDMIVYMDSSDNKETFYPGAPKGIRANLTLNLEESSGEVSLNEKDPNLYPKLNFFSPK